MTLALVLIVWQIVGPHISPIFFTYPTKIAVAFYDLTVSGDLPHYLAQSLEVMVYGLVIAVSVGISLAVLMARVRWLDWALDLAGKAESLVLIHRRDGFRAAPASVAKMKELCETLGMQFLVGQINGFEVSNGRMTEVRVTSLDGLTRRVPLDALLVFFGLSPKLGPIADWGLDLERKQLVVDTEKFETNVPGIFAVGDINLYPGKKKLILSGFHEAALAAFGATKYVFPERKIHLQYTTTSPKLHKILGVESPVFD